MLGVLAVSSLAREHARTQAATLVLVTLCCAAEAVAQQPEHTGPTRPPEYQKLRFDEDYSYLHAPSRRSDLWDPIKFMPLNASPDWHLSVGGELRERYEYYNHYRWNPASPDNDGYFLQRYLLHADLHMGESLRVFTQLQSSLEDWRAGGPRGTDEDRLDLHQAFIDLRMPIASSTDSITLRLGRQELLYGSQRLISVRESPNIRRGFDAARILTQSGDYHIDAFLARPVEEDRGTFDDFGDGHTNFWGLYATGPLPGITGAKIDLYYLGIRQPEATFDGGTATELRHSLGARLFGTSNEWDYNFEGVVQWGRFGYRDILAWTVASDTGYSFRDITFAPRLGLRADVISGDTAPGGRLGTFNALFPRGAYFGESSLIGPANLVDLHPSLELHLTDAVKLSLEWDAFWRYSSADGLYDSGGNLIRGAAGGGRFIGHQASLGVEWSLDRHTTINAAYSHFFSGGFLHGSGPGADVDYASVWIIYRF